MTAIVDFFTKLKNTAFSIGILDIVEILIMAFILYKIFVWMKDTRAWGVLKGIIAILIFALIAEIFQFNTIQYILKAATGIIVIALVVVFQPELRGALEKLGKGNILFNVFKRDKKSVMADELASMKKEIVAAVNNLAKEKTGALIVIENEDTLSEYIESGISIDATVSRQLIENIFEHNTPLHDGAIIIRNNRIEAATCYLPISKSDSISKSFGTRHRAAVGISEVSDSVTIIVSEETGKISLAKDGELIEDIGPDEVRTEIDKIFKEEPKKKIVKRGKEDEEMDS